VRGFTVAVGGGHDLKGGGADGDDLVVAAGGEILGDGGGGGVVAGGVEADQLDGFPLDEAGLGQAFDDALGGVVEQGGGGELEEGDAREVRGGLWLFLAAAEVGAEEDAGAAAMSARPSQRCLRLRSMV
jgi:hypothetical protein